MTPTSRMSTVSMATALSPESGSDHVTGTGKPPAVEGGKGTNKPASNDQTTISVAASAASLILVLVAIVIWYFLVRRQLLSKTKSHQRLGSHKSHRSNPGSRQSSFHDGHHDNCTSHKGSHHGSKHSPKSHRSASSPKSHNRHSGCCQEGGKGACTCRKSYDSPMSGRRSPQKNSMSECTGNSPFCPHSTRFQHANHRRGRDSVHSELSDQACAPVEAVCTCDLQQGQTKVITGADFTVVELEAHNKRHMNSQEKLRNGHAPVATASPLQPLPSAQCTCPHPTAATDDKAKVDSPLLGAAHRKISHVQSDPGVIGQQGKAEMV